MLCSEIEEAELGMCVCVFISEDFEIQFNVSFPSLSWKETGCQKGEFGFPLHVQGKREGEVHKKAIFQ